MTCFSGRVFTGRTKATASKRGYEIPVNGPVELTEQISVITPILADKEYRTALDHELFDGYVEYLAWSAEKYPRQFPGFLKFIQTFVDAVSPGYVYEVPSTPQCFFSLFAALRQSFSPRKAEVVCLPIVELEVPEVIDEPVVVEEVEEFAEQLDLEVQSLASDGDMTVDSSETVGFSEPFVAGKMSEGSPVLVVSVFRSVHDVQAEIALKEPDTYDCRGFSVDALETFRNKLLRDVSRPCHVTLVVTNYEFYEAEDFQLPVLHTIDRSFGDYFRYYRLRVYTKVVLETDVCRCFPSFEDYVRYVYDYVHGVPTYGCTHVSCGDPFPHGYCYLLLFRRETWDMILSTYSDSFMSSRDIYSYRHCLDLDCYNFSFLKGYFMYAVTNGHFLRSEAYSLLPFVVSDGVIHLDRRVQGALAHRYSEGMLLWQRFLTAALFLLAVLFFVYLVLVLLVDGPLDLLPVLFLLDLLVFAFIGKFLLY